MDKLLQNIDRLEMRSEQLRIYLYSLPPQCPEARGIAARLYAMHRQILTLKELKANFSTLRSESPHRH